MSCAKGATKCWEYIGSWSRVESGGSIAVGHGPQERGAEELSSGSDWRKQ